MENPFNVDTLIEQGDKLSEDAGKAVQAGKEDEGRELFRQSLSAYDSALRQAADSGYLLLCVGTQHFNLGEPVKAISYYDEAIPSLQEPKERENLIQAMINRSGALFTVGRIKEALDGTEALLKLDPGNEAGKQIKAACESAMQEK